MRSVNLRLGLSVRQWSMERHLCFSSGESQSVGEDNMDDWCLFCMWDCWSLVMSGYESSSALLPGSWNVQEWGNLREGSLVLTGIVKAVEEPEDVSVAWICYSISAEGGGSAGIRRAMIAVKKAWFGCWCPDIIKEKALPIWPKNWEGIGSQLHLERLTKWMWHWKCTNSLLCQWLKGK